LFLVFTIGDVETNQVVRRMQQRASASNQGAIRVRGIPFSCTEDELKDFFKGMLVFYRMEFEFKIIV
jgi:RNA recognition motif-containing protein